MLRNGLRDIFMTADRIFRDQNSIVDVLFKTYSNIYYCYFYIKNLFLYFHNVHRKYKRIITEDDCPVCLMDRPTKYWYDERGMAVIE